MGTIKKKHRIARITPSDFFLMTKDSETVTGKSIFNPVLVSVCVK
jgi:hypothetical protein